MFDLFAGVAVESGLTGVVLVLAVCEHDLWKGEDAVGEHVGDIVFHRPKDSKYNY